MLETVKRLLNKKDVPSFESKYVDYMLGIQNDCILFEMSYLKQHNKLDVMKLDKLVNNSLKEAMKI